jgi:Asp-tRNA(Asn)/Glu-tRNA(Gln) amidotransferase A subunit family amidase
MRTYQFSVIATGLDPEAADFADRFFEAGCDDATLSFQKGAIILDFDREARSLSHAIKSALADVESAGAQVVHIEPDHLVNLSDIATRIGITRAAASLYAKGERGQGFPAPAARVTTDSPLWDWVDVARWLHRQGRLSRAELVRARVVRRANLAIARRREDHMVIAA